MKTWGIVGEGVGMCCVWWGRGEVMFNHKHLPFLSMATRSFPCRMVSSAISLSETST